MVGSLRRTVAVANPRQVWLITAAHAVNEFYSVALPPILPLLVSDFQITYGRAGALLTVFYVMYSVFQLPAGVLADRVGKTRLLSAGMVALGGGMFLAAVAPDYRTLLLAQALAGIGGSTYHPAGMSLISDLESATTEGKAMGIHGVGGVAGTALAPALIGGLAAVADWRTALTVGAVVGVAYAAVFASQFRLPDAIADGGSADAEATEGDPNPDPEPASDGGRPGETPGWRRRLRGAVDVPLAPWVGALFVTNLIIALETGAVRTYATAYLVARTGESTAIANGIFFVMLIGGGIASLGAGELADRLDRRALGVAVLVVSGLAIGATAIVPPGPVVLLVWFFVLGLIVYAAFPAMNALTSAYSERGSSGSLFGVMLTAGSLGGAGGPLVFGVLAERVGMTTAFPLIAVVCVLGAVSFLSLYRIRPPAS